MKGIIGALLFAASAASATEQNVHTIGRGTGKTMHYSDMDTGVLSPQRAKRVREFTPSVGNLGFYESFTTRCGRIMYRNRTKILEKQARHLAFVEFCEAQSNKKQ